MDDFELSLKHSAQVLPIGNDELYMRMAWNWAVKECARRVRHHDPGFTCQTFHEGDKEWVDTTYKCTEPECIAKSIERMTTRVGRKTEEAGEVGNKNGKVTEFPNKEDH